MQSEGWQHLFSFAHKEWQKLYMKHDSKYFYVCDNMD